MIKIIIWDIRGMKSKGAYQSLVQLSKLHKVDFVGLQEPFLKSNKIDRFWRDMGYDHAIANAHSKIWCFWNSTMNCSVISKSRQQITLKCSCWEVRIHSGLLQSMLDQRKLKALSCSEPRHGRNTILVPDYMWPRESCWINMRYHNY